jgi:hypothetical protein
LTERGVEAFSKSIFTRAQLLTRQAELRSGGPLCAAEDVPLSVHRDELFGKVLHERLDGPLGLRVGPGSFFFRRRRLGREFRFPTVEGDFSALLA